MKKLLALAVAAGLAAPAIADTTIYGILDVSVDAVDSDAGTAGSTKGFTVSSNSSRLGFKGSADLNNGLKAIWKYETGINIGGADNNNGSGTGTTASTFTNRNAVVGLAGGFGAVLLGRHDTPMKIIGRKADLFYSSQLGTNYRATNVSTWDLRPNNVIAYQSPKMGGFQALAAYVTDLAGTEDATAFSINGIYNAGPLMVGLGHEQHMLEDALGPGTDRDATRLMGSYKIGKGKVVGFYQTEDNGAAADADVFGIGAKFAVSPSGSVLGQYYDRDVDGTSDDGTLFAIGYEHKLGAKTMLYGQYAKAENLVLGAGRDESYGSTTTDSDGISVGIRHSF